MAENPHRGPTGKNEVVLAIFPPTIHMFRQVKLAVTGAGR